MPQINDFAPLNKDEFDRLLIRYPQLEILLFGNVMSKKLTRELLDIDRWLMDELYKDLISYGVVIGYSSTTFRATPAALEFIKARKK